MGPIGPNIVSRTPVPPGSTRVAARTSLFPIVASVAVPGPGMLWSPTSAVEVSGMPAPADRRVEPGGLVDGPQVVTRGGGRGRHRAHRRADLVLKLTVPCAMRSGADGRERLAAGAADHERLDPLLGREGAGDGLDPALRVPSG